ncbi:MAG: saccharopine dehydrogenase NADP-binding domain-containing protein [Candidatus Eremiobacteraeota bacterium]|nr:saccharopine dehydrogenase NADP-binding domain-containing protein [Candidatus Eremiobacteraeota bacterium]
MQKKRVLALGAGAMGHVAAKTASSFDEVESLIVADLSIDAAGRVAADCGHKAKAAAINVTDRPALVSLMREADVVMNCVGPFFRFGLGILEAALEAGVNYLDICDDPEPTRDMHELHEKAREKGVTAIVGLGASPGITSMLSQTARAALDETQELIAGWNIEEDKDKLGFSAAVVHWMQQCSGTVLECDGGRLVEKKPLQDVELEYPGRGKRKVFTVGHPEPVSFHYSYPDLKRSICVMVMPEMLIGTFRGLAQSIDRNEMTLEEASKELVRKSSESNPILDVIVGADRLLTPRLPLFFVIAQGRKGEKEARAASSIKAIPPGMAEATGIPLALGTLLFLRGKVKEKGVIAPEIAFEAEEFFRLLAPYCTAPSRLDPSQLFETLVF